MKHLLSLLFLMLTVAAPAQEMKKRYPCWFTPSRRTVSSGITAGLFIGEETRQRVNGLYLELPGQGLAVIMLPGNPTVRYVDSLPACANQINGVSLSLTGTLNAELALHGLAVNPMGSYYKKLRGVNITGILGMGVEVKGINVGLFANVCDRMNGLQIGLFNTARRLRGIQIGLWNVNQKRKLPLVNWSFKG
ncbi:MAG TPA: hypothetical protein VF646_15555 [Cytophagales bacterium]|jgi:hypothetical protein